MRNNLRKFFWPLFFLFLALVWPLIPPQDPPGYFVFSDDREIFGIPCAWDVLSNLVILLAGFAGLVIFFRNRFSHDRFFKLMISIAAIWTALGSAYFHWNPLVSTVFWDRWPMTLAFSAIIAWVLSDKISEKLGPPVFLGLFLSSTAVLVFWKIGSGNLKFYFLLQYGGLLLMILLCLIFEERKLSHSKLLMAFGVYIVAKVFELMDLMIYQFFNWVSGHTIKHILAGLTLWLLLHEERN